MKFLNDKLRRLADLPNQHGYEFKGITPAGAFFKCVVLKGADGLHRIHNEATGELCYTQLQGWRELLT